MSKDLAQHVTANKTAEALAVPTTSAIHRMQMMIDLYRYWAYTYR